MPIPKCNEFTSVVFGGFSAERGAPGRRRAHVAALNRPISKEEDGGLDRVLAE